MLPICCAINLVAVGTSFGPESERVLLCLFLPLCFFAIAIPRGAELPNPTTKPRFFVTWSDGSMRCDRDGDACTVAFINASDAARDGDVKPRSCCAAVVLALLLLPACMLSNETVLRTSGAGDDLLLPDAEKRGIPDDNGLDAADAADEPPAWLLPPLRNVFIARPFRGIATEASAAAGTGTGAGMGEGGGVRPPGDADRLRRLRWYPAVDAGLLAAAATLFARPVERPDLPAPAPTPEKKDMTLVCEAERGRSAPPPPLNVPDTAAATGCCCRADAVARALRGRLEDNVELLARSLLIPPAPAPPSPPPTVGSLGVASAAAACRAACRAAAACCGFGLSNGLCGGTVAAAAATGDCDRCVAGSAGASCAVFPSCSAILLSASATARSAALSVPSWLSGLPDCEDVAPPADASAPALPAAFATAGR